MSRASSCGCSTKVMVMIGLLLDLHLRPEAAKGTRSNSHFAGVLGSAAVGLLATHWLRFGYRRQA